MSDKSRLLNANVWNKDQSQTSGLDTKSSILIKSGSRNGLNVKDEVMQERQMCPNL